MWEIYLHASRLSIWLGPPSDDSALAMNALREFTYKNTYTKLSCSQEESTAIRCLLRRAWWFRAWIVQEVAFGAIGGKHKDVVVRCGSEHITWVQLVISCARMHVNALNMRQSFPSVDTVLKLDDLASREQDEVTGVSDPYPCQLLRHLAEYRGCLASNLRDKIYAFIGLWIDAPATSEKIGGEAEDQTYRPAPLVDYSSSVEEVYTRFAHWILDNTQSLQLLHHCQPVFSSISMTKTMRPTWVPDWSQALVQARLPSTKEIEEASVPWWSLPVRDDHSKCRYLMGNRQSRRESAKGIFYPARSNFHYIPEWAVDLMDPDGTKGFETMLKELQSRPDVLFCFSDDSGRALGDEREDTQFAIERTQDHNEKMLQRRVLSQYFQDKSLLRTQYKASGQTPCKASIKGKELRVRGIISDTIHRVFVAFPADLTEDWMQSARLMVQIGLCKQAITETNIEKGPFSSEEVRLTAFWKTLFAGQQVSNEANVVSWLPHIPQDWQCTTPTLTVLESGRLEYAEIQSMIEGSLNHLADMDPEEGVKYVHKGFDEDLAKDDGLLDGRWNSSERLGFQRSFAELGRHWVTQPYDLYHRPFHLPYVVPDPYWEHRRKQDNIALKASIDARHRTVIESLEGTTRDVRKAFRRFMADKIRQQPAREPQGIDDTALIKYALGRRFFVSKDGYFGLAPPDAQEGDRIAVLFGVNVPFILRKIGLNYQIVGESYVHGLMNGEIVEMWRLGIKKCQDLVLI